MFNPKSLHIIDGGLLEPAGHYYTQDFSIANECRRRGIPVKIYCRNGAKLGNPEITTIDIFRFDIFVESSNQNSEFGVYENYFLVNRAFYEDLCLISVENFSSEDLIYFPTITQNQIEAISDWIISIPLNQRPRVAITLRVLNSQVYYNVDRGYSKAIDFLYRHALLKLIERHPSTHLFTDTTALATSYRMISGITVINLPIPQIEFNQENILIKSQYKNKLSILYIGNISNYRGFRFIPSIIESVLSEFPDVEFVIQVKADPSSDDARTMTAISDAFSKKVRFIFGNLSPSEYLRTMKDADIVLLPYLPSYYCFGSSGVFTEAAALAKVLVITKGTTMETTSNEYNLGAVISEEYTADAFSVSLKEAVRNFEVLDKKAKDSYISFAQANSPEGFVERMLGSIVN